MIDQKRLPILLLFFLFPVLITTVQHGGGVIYILILLLGLVLGWPAWRSLESWEKKGLIAFILFFALMSLSLLNAEDVDNAVKRMGRYLHFPLFIPMYLLLKKYQIEVGKAFLYGVLVSSIGLFGQSLYQIIVLDVERAIGAYNSIILGDVSMLVAVIVICALLTVAQKWQHYLIGVVSIILALSASVMSGSRGAWILLPVVFLWLVWIKRKNVKVVPLVSILGLGLLLFVGALNIDQVKNRVDSVVTDYEQYSKDPTVQSSMMQRLEMWRASVVIWEKNPIIGTGPGDFKRDCAQLVEDKQSYLPKLYGHAHNIYFDALATTGIVGLLAIIVFIQVLPFKMFYTFWVREHDEWLKFYALSGMVTIIAFAVFGLTEGWLSRNSFVRTYLMTILVFMSSIGVIRARKVQGRVEG